MRRGTSQAPEGPLAPYVVSQALAGAAPYVVTEHGSALNFSVRVNDDLVPYAIEGLRGAARIATVSQGACDDLVAWAAEHGESIEAKIVVMSPGIDAELFAPARDRDAALAALRSQVTLPEGFPLSPDDDILVYAGAATSIVGNWQAASDGTAAGGVRMWNPNRGAAKITSAQANPPDYFEVRFNATAGVGYRLWMRGKAESNSYSNDSVFVQFDGSVTASVGGSATFRIGTSSATEYNLENCSGCGVAAWGWQDNAYGNGVWGSLIYFASTGEQTMRVQVREDGLSIDQIMLSPEKFRSTAPGTPKNDTTIYPATDGSGGPPPPPPPPSSNEVVLYASTGAPTGNWVVESDADSAGGFVMHNPNLGAAKIVTPSASPADYFEMTFTAGAGIPYHFWMRARAQNNSYSNDSVYVQFSDSVDQNGTAVYQIGTASAADPNLEDCSGCGLYGWGWQDNGWGVGVTGPDIYFASTGTHTMRVQVREDGIYIDQLMLSPSRFLTTPPGALKNDTNIYAESTGSVP